MIEISIPGYRKLHLEHLVMDYNGTLACDGILEESVKPCLEELARDLSVHIVTADTFGSVRSTFSGDPYKVEILPKEDQAGAKLGYIREIGPDRCVVLGNGRNDRLMLEQAALGIGVMLAEGMAREALEAADVLVFGIVPALELLTRPLRLTATLRS